MKTYIITGASNGIGAATVKNLTSHGHHVIGLSRNEKKLSALQKECGNLFEYYSCDVRDEKNIKSVFETILKKHNTIDGLINNAGLGIFNQLESVSLDEWKTQLETNLTGTFLCTQAIVPAMKSKNGGIIINIASIAGKLGIAEAGAYNASKFGVVGFSESIMHELRSFGIRVTCICPGSVDTNFFDNVSKKMEASKMMKAEDIANMIQFVVSQPDHLIIDTIIMRPTSRA